MSDKNEGLTKLRKLLKGVRICMLTTRDMHDNLRARPMALQQTEIDGDLWFFTGRHSHKVDEIGGDHRVNVSVIDGNTFLSISGTAMLIDDKVKAKELWNPEVKVWFPKGLEDPELLLIKVSIEQAEYWDNPGGVVTLLIGYVGSLATGKPPKVGEHDTVKL